MSLDQLRDSIRAAYKMSRLYGKPAYVYRRDNPYVVTLDEGVALQQGDYTRCDAQERLEEENPEPDDDDAVFW